MDISNQTKDLQDTLKSIEKTTREEPQSSNREFNNRLQTNEF